MRTPNTTHGRGEYAHARRTHTHWQHWVKENRKCRLAQAGMLGNTYVFIHVVSSESMRSRDKVDSCIAMRMNNTFSSH